MKTVREIMEPVTTWLLPTDTLAEAVRKMRTTLRKPPNVYGVKGMVVVDTQGTLVGIVSVKDILRAIMPSYMELAEVGGMTWPGMFEEMAQRVKDKPVSEIMHGSPVYVSPDATLMECAELIVKKNLWRLPVLEDEKLIGIVYARDLHYAIATELFGET